MAGLINYNRLEHNLPQHAVDPLRNTILYDIAHSLSIIADCLLKLSNPQVPVEPKLDGEPLEEG